MREAPADPGRSAGGIRPAATADVGSILTLLADAGLPPDGVVEAVTRFVVMEAPGGIVGVAGLEIHGSDGVLRSVAVSPARRDRGMGRALTETVIRSARKAGLRRLYLLTTTADRWFPRFGFRPIERAEASPEVRRSVEFREACPASATAMVLDLEPAEKAV